MKPLAQIAKQLAARLAFLISLMVLLPLAVLNRQSVSVSLNPMDLLRDTPQAPLFMPLFIALFASFIFGLLAGWVIGRFGKNAAKRAMPRRSGVIETRQDKTAKADNLFATRRLGNRPAAPPLDVDEKAGEKAAESDEQDEK